MSVYRYLELRDKAFALRVRSEFRKALLESLATIAAGLVREAALNRKEVPLSEAHSLLTDDEITDWPFEHYQPIASGFERPLLRASGGSYSGGFLTDTDLLYYLRADLRRALRGGTFVARGIEVGKELTGKITGIPAHAWQVFEPDYQACTATLEREVVLRAVSVARASGHRARNKGGRPMKADWETVRLRILRKIEKHGPPSPHTVKGWRTQQDVERLVHDLLAKDEIYVSESTVRNRVRNILRTKTR